MSDYAIANLKEIEDSAGGPKGTPPGLAAVVAPGFITGR